MNNKINIDKFEKTGPFSVPENYFSELKSEIQIRCKTKKNTYPHIFQYILPILGSFLIIFYLFTNTRATSISVTEVKINQSDLITYLAEEISEDLLYKHASFENDEMDELSDDIDYLLEYDMDYNLIINQL